MQTNSDAGGVALPHRIELNLRDVNQLFNTMDPSPFHEKDLDHDAEEFIVSWAREFPVQEPLILIVHLGQFPERLDPKVLIEQGVHHYFEYRARMNKLAFRQLMQEGRQSLLIGLVFLAACLVFSEALAKLTSGTVANVIRESFTIGGWVAMWRPMEIYLYDWWPLRRRGKVFEKLSDMPVEVRQRQPNAS